MFIDQQAPEFTATACMGDNSFQEVKLSDFRGKKHVVLFFWPADFTFVCASEVPGFEKLAAEFEKRNVQILGCSTDTEHVHKAWKLATPEQGGIGKVSYPMLADKTKEIATAYDMLLCNGLCARGVFVINKEGVVKAMSINCLPVGRNFNEVLRIVDAIQFHEKSLAEGKEQVCPASWMLGKKGMTPTTEGVVSFGKEQGGLAGYV